MLACASHQPEQAAKGQQEGCGSAAGILYQPRIKSRRLLSAWLDDCQASIINPEIKGGCKYQLAASATGDIISLARAPEAGKRDAGSSAVICRAAMARVGQDCRRDHGRGECGIETISAHFISLNLTL